MTSNEIVDAVTSYVRDENAKYAILIDGEWGSGKTYLYENYLVEAIDSIEIGKNERKYNVYISLYGTSSIESLAKQLITDYLIFVKGHRNKNVKKRLKPLASIVGVVSSAFSFSIGPVSADIASVFDKIENSFDVKNMVICFDDLERCTIPINEFFGFVNNLVEHCNCKVVILADEKNIGKIYANTNLEKKYLTVLSGDRKVVQNTGDEKNIRTQKAELGRNSNGEITVEEVKKLNEILYSENYLYRDIKEKVIGKTLLYCPPIKSVIAELINGNKKNKGIIQDGRYKEFLLKNLDAIASAFNETDNHNLRIIKTWLFTFRRIYDTATKYYSDNKYYEDILSDFLRYSIWVTGALKRNKKIAQCANYVSQDLVYYEGHEYTHIYKYSFIDAWITRDVWSDEDLSQACRSIIKRREREDVDHPPRLQSTGKALSELREWYYMDDEQVKETLDCLEKEVEESKYAYYDYSSILSTLLFLQEKGLYTGDIGHIKNVMIDLIKKDSNIQEENEFPKDFSSEELRNKYNEVYMPISEARKMRNREISKENQEEDNIYNNANAFLDYCCKMENYYCSHKSFVGYLDIEKLYKLINESDNEGLHTLRRAFKTIYFMSNLKEFYVADIDGLKRLRNGLRDETIIKHGGITRQIALDAFADMIKQDLILLGVDEDQL